MRLPTNKEAPANTIPSNMNNHQLLTPMIFNNISEYLPQGHIMVFNDTKVVPARLHFQRESGAHIEIFCLEPVSPEEYVSMFACTGRCSWKCIVGNVKRWKGDTLKVYNPENQPRLSEIDLKADLVERNGETSVVEFSWTTRLTPYTVTSKRPGTIPDAENSRLPGRSIPT